MPIRNQNVMNRYWTGTSRQRSVRGMSQLSRSERLALIGFLFAAMGMFATMYSTQAILPILGADFHVSPSQAGLTISALVIAIAVGAWIWGPVSDRIGQRRSLVLASALVVPPVALSALAPTFPALLALRALQGLCMPGLLVVGVPYVIRTFGPAIGSRVMGWYVAMLVVGGMVGRLGVAFVADLVGWRLALGLLALFPALAALIMRRYLPEETQRLAGRADSPLRALRTLVASPTLVAASMIGPSIFFSFVGVFTYIEYRLQDAPFHLSTTGSSLVFTLWLFGAVGPQTGRLVERFGWRRVATTCLVLALIGVVLSTTSSLPVLILALSLMAIGMFGGATSTQVGVARSNPGAPGLASAFYFSVYYGAGALGGWLPGIAWQADGWSGVVLVTMGVLIIGLVGSVVRPAQRLLAAASA